MVEVLLVWFVHLLSTSDFLTAEKKNLFSVFILYDVTAWYIVQNWITWHHEADPFSTTVVSQRLKTAPALYRSVICVSVFPTGRHWALSWASWNSPHPHMLLIAHLRQQCHNSKFVIFQEKRLKVLKCYNFLWVQRRHNCSPAASFAICVMTLYLLKVHLQTFLSVPVTQKCQILSCDTLVANERYIRTILVSVFHLPLDLPNSLIQLVLSATNFSPLPYPLYHHFLIDHRNNIW
jgi:hypothetical protein